MTDAKYHTPEHGGLQGRTFRPNGVAELAEAIELVFDYRGDVTLELASGERLVGYVFNRVRDTTPPYVDLFLDGQPKPRRIGYQEILTLTFTGKDTASGKSWESWVAKKESQRKAEAEQVAADARARGYL